METNPKELGEVIHLVESDMENNECWVDESVEDNEGIANDSISGSKVQSNGSCAVENSDKNELNLEVADGSDHGELKKPEELSPFPTTMKKGYGLKKWRRIRRDANRDGDNSSIDSGNMEAHEAPHSGAKPSKRVQYSDRKEKSEGSVSSTNAVVTNFDGFPLLDDSSYNLGLSPSFAAGTDSENSEDRSSKSSTAASAPKIKYEILGFPRDKSKMSSISLNGKSLTHAGQLGHHGKGRTETGKKARGERVKIEKENSHSSVESDSRSNTFVFVQGTSFTNNGILNEVTNEYDGENGDEVQGTGNQDGYGKDGEGGFEDLSTEDGVADSSWAGKEEASENHGSMRDKDPLAESMRALLSVQEALQEEVNKFKEIGNDVSVDGPISDLCNEYIDVEQKLQETSGEGSQSSSQPKDVEAVAELEDIFKQKIEAEVEYLAISRTVQELRIAAVDQISVLEQTKVLDKLGHNENKAAALEKQAEKLEKFCEEIANADKIMELKKDAYKHSSCFLMQFVLLFVVLSFFIHQFSQDYVEVVPT